MRTYSTEELRALRAVSRREWRGSDDPAHGGPAQFAGGDHWPDELERKAREFDRLAPAYRLASEALRREIRDHLFAGHDPDAATARGESEASDG